MDVMEHFRPRDVLGTPASPTGNMFNHHRLDLRPQPPSPLASIPRPLPLTLKYPLVSPQNPAADAMRIAHPHRLELSRQQHAQHLTSCPHSGSHVAGVASYCFQDILSLVRTFPYPLFRIELPLSLS